jgi:hypothetical protein
MLAALVPAAQAAEALTLDSALDAIARNVAGVLKEEQNARQIVVNPITDKTDLTHNAGSGITEALIAKLRAHGLEPALKAEFIFDGKYRLGEESVDGVRKGVAIGSLAFTVTRRNGQTLIDSEKDLPLDQRPRVSAPRDLARMGGLTVALPPTASSSENDKKVLDALDNPPGLFEIAGTKIRPRGAPYAIEMLVAPAAGSAPPRHEAFRPRAVEVRQGMPFLKVQPGEAVAVRIINDASHDAAATVSVDGLSMFAFRDHKADKNEHVIVKKGAAGDVLGWFRNARKSNAFLVKDLPQDHPQALFLKDPAKIGAITVTFAAAWAKDADRPADEDGTRQATEIDQGAPIDAPYESLRRNIGGFRAAVTVRYDKM